MFDTLYAWVASQVQNNDIFAGVVLAGAFSSLYFSAKYIPKIIWARVRRYFSYTFTVSNDQRLFGLLEEWMDDKLKEQFRTTKLTDSDDKGEPIFSIGYGSFLVWHQRKPIIITRDKKDNNQRLEEVISVTSFGRSKTLILSILRDAVTLRIKDTVPIYVYDGWWRRFSDKQKRNKDTIFIDQLDDIIKDLETFQNRKEWYADKGIPYKRVYLLQGPPGTGKSTLPLFLAAHFNKKIYYANLSSFSNDNDFLLAMSCIDTTRSIIVIEEVDTFKVTEKRETTRQDSTEVEVSVRSKEETETPLTLSTFLNCLDGPLTPDGLTVFMTTNHPEKLDAAILRDSRVDVNLEIGYINGEMVNKMISKFFDKEITIELSKDKIYTPSSIQSILISSANENDAIEKIQDRFPASFKPKSN